MALIDWSEPIFHDNSITPLTITRSPGRIEIPTIDRNFLEQATEGMGMGMFPIGETTTVNEWLMPSSLCSR